MFRDCNVSRPHQSANRRSEGQDCARHLTLLKFLKCCAVVATHDGAEVDARKRALPSKAGLPKKCLFCPRNEQYVTTLLQGNR